MQDSSNRDELIQRLGKLPDDAILTVDEVASWLNVTPNWVRSHASANRRPFLPGFKAGKYVRFRWGTLKEWARSLSEKQQQRKRRP